MVVGPAGRIVLGVHLLAHVNDYVIIPTTLQVEHVINVLGLKKVEILQMRRGEVRMVKQLCLMIISKMVI